MTQLAYYFHLFGTTPNIEGCVYQFEQRAIKSDVTSLNDNDTASDIMEYSDLFSSGNGMNWDYNGWMIKHY